LRDCARCPAAGFRIPLVSASPFDLVATFDYLDVIWRLKFKAPLVALPGAERVARMATDATSSEEFDSRLSARGISRSDSYRGTYGVRVVDNRCVQVRELTEMVADDHTAATV
jgi:hypothetical protein